MGALMLAVALAGGTRLELPVPRDPDPSDTSTCLVLDAKGATLSETSIDDGRWEVSCSAKDGDFMLCLRVLAPHAPRRPIPLRCDADKRWIEAVPIVAYDRNDDPTDGVSILRGTRGAVFFTAGSLPDAQGSMEGGHCAVQRGVLIINPTRRLRKDRVCTLSTTAGPNQVQVRVVDQLAEKRPAL